jgi:hypothetical protein
MKSLPMQTLVRLMQNGWSERRIASYCEREGLQGSKSSIHRRVVKLRNNGWTFCKPTQKIAGQLTQRTKNWLRRQIRVHNIRTTKGLQQSLADIQVHVCCKTVRRWLHTDPCLLQKQPKREYGVTKKMRINRLAWAKEQLAQNFDWKQAIFADEKVWKLDGPDSRPLVWCHKSDPRPIMTRSGARNRSVYMWGAVFAEGMSNLVCLPRKFKSEKYIEVLQEGIINGQLSHLTLVHDRLPVHNSEVTRRWMEDQ